MSSGNEKPAGLSSSKPIFTIVFLRHGESVGNAEARYQGWAEFPLTEAGRAQSRALAKRWLAYGLGFDLIVSSPLARARETAEIIAGTLPAPLEFDPDWKEWNNGHLAGLTFEEAKERYARPPFLHPYQPIGETGESRWELYLRAGRAVQSLLKRQPGRYLVVSHGAILNMALYAVLGISPQPDDQGPRFRFENTAYATFEYDPHRHGWHMLEFNSHNAGKSREEL